MKHPKQGLPGAERTAKQEKTAAAPWSAVACRRLSSRGLARAALTTCPSVKIVCHAHPPITKRRHFAPEHVVGILGESRCGTVGVLFRARHKPVLHRVVLRVIDSRIVALLIGQPRVPVLKPDPASGRAVQPVQLPCGQGMHTPHSIAQGQPSISGRSQSHAVIVVWKNSPGLGLPTVFAEHPKERVLKKGKPGVPGEQRPLVQRAGRDHVNTPRFKPVDGGVMPPARLVRQGFAWSVGGRHVRRAPDKFHGSVRGYHFFRRACRLRWRRTLRRACGKKGGGKPPHSKALRALPHPGEQKLRRSSRAQRAPWSA